MFSPERAWRALGAGVAVGVALAAAVPLPAAAAPGAPPAPPAELAAKGPTVEVTLLTGDTVRVGKLASGKYFAAQPTAASSRSADAPVGFQTLSTPTNDLYVIPSDAGAAIAAGQLDRELFNVARLVEEGHAGTDELPVIIQYGAANAGARAAKQADALPATTGVRSLESIDAAGVDLATDQRAQFWAKLRGQNTGARTLSVGIERVWLDRQVQVTLDRSVAQIGAPAAWEAGFDGSGVTVAVLDTGYDAAHPDLAGKVTEARSFVPELTVKDGHGHGTHVAATVAGSGNGADGRYRGVAPGADLLVGKVLDDAGNGLTSWIVDGMEWAAGAGATAVNMSLGGDPSDGTDPLSLAVERLTEETGTLFVIAAGNAGPGKRTLAAPGSAPSALTVGAVDRNDQLADFSSRGPVVGSYAVKPDLTAPGVGIVAARASGTSMGAPVNDLYTAANGTSMATPHVAGAVALLAQQHPDWTGQQLKSALTGSATPNDTLTGYEQGSGRLDVARAIDQRLTASPYNVDFGRISHDQTGPKSETVTLTNHGDTALVVDLATTLRGPTGDAASTLTVEPSTVTVPANGTAQATVTFTVRPEGDGGYTGTIRGLDAASGAELVRLAFGAYQAPEEHRLRLVANPPAGWPNTYLRDWSNWVLVRVDAPQDPIFVGRGEGNPPTAEVFVPDGVYAASVSYWHFHPRTGDFTMTQLVNPEFVVKGADTELVVDGRSAVPIRVRTPRPSEIVDVHQGLLRGTTYGGDYDMTWLQGEVELGRTTVQVTPTKKVTVGTAKFITGIEAVEAQSDLRILGRNAPELDPTWLNRNFQRPMLDTHRRVGLVDVGGATEQEIARAGVRGKVALVTRSIWETFAINIPEAKTKPVLERLRKAGALAVLLAVDEGVAYWCGPAVIAGNVCEDEAALPVLRLGPEEATELRAYLAGKRSVSALLTARSKTTYDYRLRFVEPTVSTGIYQVNRWQLHDVRSNYRTSEPRDLRRYSATIGMEGAFRGTASWRHTPAVRSSYVGPVNNRALLWTQQTSIRQSDRQSADWSANALVDSSLDTYARPGRSTREWGAPGGVGAQRVGPEIMNGPLATSVPWIEGCLFCRNEDGLTMFFPSQIFGDGSQFGENYLWHAVYRPDQLEARLYREGTELPTALLGVAWDLSQYPEPADYRFTQKIKPYGYQYGPAEIETTWWFRSEQATKNEALTGFECFGQTVKDPATAKCRVERMLQFGWELAPVIRSDRSGDPSRYVEFPLHVYRQHGAPQGSPVNATVQVSYDSGKTWQSARVDRKANGEFEVRIAHPRGALVTLRAQAWDRDGNRVEQTLHDAYRVATRR